MINSGENSKLKRKFSTKQKVLHSGENSQVKRKFSTQEEILN